MHNTRRCGCARLPVAAKVVTESHVGKDEEDADRGEEKHSVIAEGTKST
jgi:hypothetical protein